MAVTPRRDAGGRKGAGRGVCWSRRKWLPMHYAVDGCSEPQSRVLLGHSSRRPNVPLRVCKIQIHPSLSSSGEPPALGLSAKYPKLLCLIKVISPEVMVGHRIFVIFLSFCDPASLGATCADNDLDMNLAVRVREPYEERAFATDEKGPANWMRRDPPTQTHSASTRERA